MKKLGLLISIIALMFLSGCLSEKTKEKLNEVPGEVEIKVNYQYTTSIPEDSLLESVAGKYYSLKRLKTLTDSIQNAFNETTGKETFKINKNTSGIYPKVDLVVSVSDIKIDDQKSGIIGEYITDTIKTESKFGNGEILFPIQGVNGSYQAYQIVTNNNETFYVYFALLRKKITLLDTTEKEITYLLTNITKTKGDCTSFETVLKTISTAEQNISAEIDGDEKAQEEKQLFVNLNSALQKEEIRTALDNLYTHIKKYYSTEAGIITGMTQEEKLVKIWEYANELKPSVEFNTYQLVRNKVSTLSSYILKELEGGLAELYGKLSTVNSASPKYSLIKSETTIVESKMKEYQETIQEQRYIEKKDGKLFTTQYILFGASSDYASKPLYKMGVKYLTIAKLIQLTDLDEYGEKQGEEREYQISRVLEWYNVVNRDYDPVLKAMYANEGNKESAVRDYVDKTSINKLYAGLTNDYLDFYNKLVISGDKTQEEVDELKSALILTLQNKMVESGKVIIAQVGNYYTTNVGIYYKTKAIGEIVNKLDAERLKNEIDNSFRVYMEKIKFYNTEVIPALDLVNKRDWEYVKGEINDSTSEDIYVTLFKQHTALYQQVIDEYDALP